MSTTSKPIAHELVPLADRLRAMRLFRLGAAALVLLAWWALPEVRAASAVEAVGATGLYLLVLFAIEGVWRASGRRALSLFGVMLMLDGVYLGWIAYVMAGATSPLRWLVLVHIVTVALLASFRTGLKLAFWHSLLVLVVFHAQEAGVVPTTGNGVSLGGVEYRSLIAYAVAFWVVAIATASFAAVNERELRRRRYDLEALRSLSVKLELPEDDRAVAEAVVDAVRDDFDFPRVAFLGLSGAGPVLLAAHNAEKVEFGAAEGSPLVQRALDAREPLLAAKVTASDDPIVASVLPENDNIVIVPLFAEGRGIGALVAEHGLRRGSRIERRVLSMLERYGSQGALALANAWHVQQLRLSASTDGLTGVANRRTFDASLARELARAARKDEPVSLAMFDLDHFKQLNDEHGHLTGDHVLRGAGTVLKSGTRLADTLARYGGEEFAVVMPGLDGVQAFEAAERLRLLLAGVDSPTPVTASAGIATFPQDARDPLSLIDAADRALYAAKREGRDRALTASTTTNVQTPLQVPVVDPT